MLIPKYKVGQEVILKSKTVPGFDSLPWFNKILEDNGNKGIIAEVLVEAYDEENFISVEVPHEFIKNNVIYIVDGNYFCEKDLASLDIQMELDF